MKATLNESNVTEQQSGLQSLLRISVSGGPLPLRLLNRSAPSEGSKCRTIAFSWRFPCSFLQSEIPGIEEVEQASRVLDGAGVCVEGKKP
jgi:hypothetical protein